MHKWRGTGRIALPAKCGGRGELRLGERQGDKNALPRVSCPSASPNRRGYFQLTSVRQFLSIDTSVDPSPFTSARLVAYPLKSVFTLRGLKKGQCLLDRFKFSTSVITIHGICQSPNIPLISRMLLAARPCERLPPSFTCMQYGDRNNTIWCTQKI